MLRFGELASHGWARSYHSVRRGLDVLRVIGLASEAESNGPRRKNLAGLWIGTSPVAEGDGPAYEGVSWSSSTNAAVANTANAANADGRGGSFSIRDNRPMG